MNAFSLEPSDCGSSGGMGAGVSETVLAGVDSAGGEGNVEAIVPFALFWKKKSGGLRDGVKGVGLCSILWWWPQTIKLPVEGRGTESCSYVGM